MKNNFVPQNNIPRSAGSVAEGVFLITGLTIGAGVLGLPYAIAQVGIQIGLLYLFGFGILMICLNLLIVEIAENTRERFQLPGLAGKYIGPWARHLLSAAILLSSYGALLAYIVGEGQILSGLFGGNSFWWSIGFWLVGSVVVARGLGATKNMQKFLSFIVIVTISGLSFFLLRSVQLDNWLYTNTARLLFPWGIILFALHGSPAVIEAKALLEHEPQKLRRAVIIGSSIPIVVYALFTLAVVRVLGISTSPIATTALATRFGGGVVFASTLFGLCAMATSFIGLGLALKESLAWDDKLSPVVSTVLVFAVPIILFVTGFRNFIGILNIVGAVFIGFEVIAMIAVYWRAKKQGIFGLQPRSRFAAWLLTLTVVLLVVGGITLKLFQRF